VIPDIRIIPLFTVFLRVAPIGPVVIGDVPTGLSRRLTAIDGGHFTGDRLSGRVITGNDAVVIRSDGTAHLDVRCALETDAGEMIYLTYQGRRTQTAAPADEYFRCIFQFETSSERLSWLNDIVGVGSGRREPDGPWYEVFEVK
jgi:hypothetical protein